MKNYHCTHKKKVSDWTQGIQNIVFWVVTSVVMWWNSNCWRTLLPPSSPCRWMEKTMTGISIAVKISNLTLGIKTRINKFVLETEQ